MMLIQVARQCMGSFQGVLAPNNEGVMKPAMIADIDAWRSRAQVFGLDHAMEWVSLDDVAVDPDFHYIAPR